MSLTTTAARQTGIAAAQLEQLADHSETIARGLIAQGVPMREALARAADETMEIARSLGMLPVAS